MKNLALFTFLLSIFVSTALTPAMAQEELTYLPVDPCRIVDTRSGGGAITANTFRNFLVSGSMGELAVQGGQTDCLDPKAGSGQKPLAISAYVVAVPASGSSNGVLTAYPSHLLPPPVGAGSTVNFAAGQVIGNTTNITLCDQVTCPTDGEFAILARNTNQHVVIDVQGYFYPSAAKQLMAVDANGNELGLVFGGNTQEISISTTQGYAARVFPSSAVISSGNSLGIAFTDTDCGNSGGQAYAGYFYLYMPGTVISAINDFSQPQPLFFVPQSSTFVSNITVQSERGSGGCQPTNKVLQKAQEVFPNDPVITGIPNSPIPAPISIEYR